jgi:hypothetical protein
MKQLALRTLQFAIAVAISILGGLIAAHSRGGERDSRGRQGSCPSGARSSGRRRAATNHQIDKRIRGLEFQLQRRSLRLEQ